MTGVEVAGQGGVGPWTLVRLVGSGSMGEVWEGRSPSGERVAVKRIRGALAGDDRVRRHFLREARAAARLSHPHIVEMIDFVSEGGQSALVMEFVEGEPLSVWRRTPPSGAQLLEVFDQMLSALSYAHARGVIHRDLKPENVLLTQEGGRLTSRLMDLGVAHFRDEQARERWSEDTLVGTPAYMGPEQALQSADVSPATDLYAVGVMLHELLTGHLPFEGQSAMGTMMAHLREPVPPLVLRTEYVEQEGLDSFVSRMLAKIPEDRFRFALEARRALSACVLRRAEDPPARERTLRLRGRVESPPASERAERFGTACSGLAAVQDTPFVGRQEQLAALLAEAERVVEEGRTRVVLVEGSMGLGRSRLIQRLREILEEEGRLQTWVGTCRTGFDDEGGIRHAVEDGLRSAGMGAAELDQRVRRTLQRQGEVRASEAADLVRLLRPEESSGGRGVGGGEAARFALVDRLTLRAAREFPLCMVLEDVHETNGAPLRLASRLLREVGGSAPRLVVLSLQPEEVAGHHDLEVARERLVQVDASRVRAVTLGRLREQEMRRLVKAMLALPDSAADAVALRAEGNPLIAVELVRHLVDSGRVEGLGLEVTSEELLLEWPEGVHALVRRRIESAARTHGEEQLGLWERLSWLGTRFDLSLALELLLLEGPAVAERLDRAIAAAIVAGFLVEERPNLFRFQHGLLRDAVREIARERGEEGERALRAAQARERAHGGGDGPHLLMVARDYATAGAWPQAIDAYERAARSAHRSQRFSDACEAWGELAQLLGREGVAFGAERDLARGRALLGLAGDALLLGRFDELRRAVAEVEGLCDSAGVAVPAEATRLLAEVEQRSGNTRLARQLFVEALEGFARRGDVRGGARARFGLGLLDLHDGRISDAEAHMREALVEFEAVGDDVQATHCFSTLGRTALAAGLLDEAAGLIEKARYRHDERGDRLGLAHAHLNLAEVALARGDAEAASEHGEKGRAYFGEMGAEHGLAHAAMALGRAAAMDGRASVARDRYDEAQQLFEELGDAQSLSTVHLCRAMLDAEEHNWEEASRRAREALARDAEERIDDPIFVDLLVGLSRTAIFGGMTELAIELLEAAAFKLRRMGEESALSDKLDEVQYLLVELRDGGTVTQTGPMQAVKPGKGQSFDDV